MIADIYYVLTHSTEITLLHWESLYLQSDTERMFPKQKNQAVWDRDVVKQKRGKCFLPQDISKEPLCRMGHREMDPTQQISDW